MIDTDTQATPGAGEGERWEKREVKNGVYSFWSVVCDNRQVAQCLTEADADLICILHNERTHLVSRDAYVEVRDAREADQQTIAELRKALEVGALARENRHRYEHTPQEPTWDDHERAGCGWCSDCLIKLDALEEEAYTKALAAIAATEENA